MYNHVQKTGQTCLCRTWGLGAVEYSLQDIRNTQKRKCDFALRRPLEHLLSCDMVSPGLSFLPKDLVCWCLKLFVARGVKAGNAYCVPTMIERLEEKTTRAEK